MDFSTVTLSDVTTQVNNLGKSSESLIRQSDNIIEESEEAMRKLANIDRKAIETISQAIKKQQDELSAINDQVQTLLRKLQDEDSYEKAKNILDNKA